MFNVSGAGARSLLHSSREKRRNGERRVVSVSRVMSLSEPANRTHLVSPGSIGREKFVTDELLDGAHYLPVGMTFKRVAEVSAVDLAVSEVRTEASVQDAGSGGEGE